MRAGSYFALVALAVLPGAMADFYMRQRFETDGSGDQDKFYSFVDEKSGWCNRREIRDSSDVSGHKQGVRDEISNNRRQIEINTGLMHVTAYESRKDENGYWELFDLGNNVKGSCHFTNMDPSDSDFDGPPKDDCTPEWPLGSTNIYLHCWSEDYTAEAMNRS